LVVGATVHGFNRWQWTEADFDVVGGPVRFPLDGLSLRYGDGAAAAKQALASTPNRYHVLDRRTVFFPPTRNNNAMVGYNTAVGTLAELSVDATNGKVAVLAHHTILEGGNMLVPELVSGSWRAHRSGIGLALRSCRSTRADRATAPELQSLPAAWRSRCGRRPRNRPAAVGQRTAQGHGCGDPDRSGHREHRPCHRPSLHAAGNARPILKVLG
jgi:hypothetical protein